MNLFKTFHRYGRIMQKAKREREREDRNKSVSMGITSIVFSLLGAVALIGGAYLFSLASGDNFVLIIFAVIFGAAAALASLVFFIDAVMRWILQLTINRGWSGWCAIVLFALAVGAAIFFALKIMEGLN